MYPPKDNDVPARIAQEIRELVEGEILASVEWPDQTTLQALHEQLDRLAALRGEGKRTEWAAELRAFQDSIFDLSPRKLMVREARRLWALTDRYRSLLYALPTQDLRRNNGKSSSELRVLQALAQHDAKSLRKAMDDERRHARDKLLELLSARGM